ncbi:hypothetical protein N657DRAFT_634759 [Parathielavia appendiculata]|uniref:Uncharacterized protein n=1 Tax=Parathielavia appendiculata TaxID=2587402 RepID=A0AAN6Z3J1_9PEZI|nr:hypothetical protein N657DRAFT_634759 [Parathielavia appendiculata]
MSLLDLFTSLMLQNPDGQMKSRNLLLLQRAQALIESIQRNDHELMRSRPFNPIPARQSGVRDESSGTVPKRKAATSKGSPLTKAQECIFPSASGTALQEAKLERNPSMAMNALARLQLDTRGDMDGYLATCLSRYIVSKEGEDEMKPLRNLERVDGVADELWAWTVIRVLLVATSRANSARSGDVDDIAAKMFTDENAAKWCTLPSAIMLFSREELGISAG